MSSPIYAPAAEDDLVGIAAFIAQDSPAAARRWIQEIRETCDLLVENPLLGEERPEFGVSGCRRISVGAYVIFFRTMENNLVVARVIHGSRDLTNLYDLLQATNALTP
jgi:toxin ParE1/3/4